MKRLFKFKYPKILSLIIIVFFTYILFQNSSVNSFVSNLGALSYLGVFIAGILFSFGFTTPIAIGFFITLNPSNLFLVGVIGGLGALISDLFIYKIIKLSFMDEFRELEKAVLFKEGYYLINKTIRGKIKLYLTYAFAGIIIASPLPDEIGVGMLAGLTKIKPNILAIISFIFNTIGILIILLI
jgi:hypothetical protein